MAKGDIRIDLDLDSSGFTKGINKAKGGVKRFTSGAMGQLLRLGAAFAGIGLVKSVLDLGKAAEETGSKFNAVFGPAAAGVQKELERLNGTIPGSIKELQDATATFGQLTQAMGFSQETAAEFSLNMLKIAGDLASFNDQTPDEVFLKIQSAISGEFEPLKRLGFQLNEAALKTEGLTLKVWDGVGAMSAQQKALVIQSLLIKQGNLQLGNAAATADSASNQQKFLTAQLKDQGAVIGTTLLPAFVSVVGWIKDFINWTDKATQTVGGFLAVVAERVEGKGFFGGLKEILSTSLGDIAKMQKEAKVRLAAATAIEDTETNKKIIAERARANEEYLNSLNEQIRLAGKLEGIVSTTAEATKEQAAEADKVAKAATKTVTAVQTVAPSSGAGEAPGTGAAGVAKRFFSGSASVRGAASGIGGAANTRSFNKMPGSPNATDVQQVQKENLLQEMRDSLKVIETEMKS